MINNFFSFKGVDIPQTVKKIEPARSKPIVHGIAISAPAHGSPLHIFYSVPRRTDLGITRGELIYTPASGSQLSHLATLLGKDNLILLPIQSICSLVYLLPSSIKVKKKIYNPYGAEARSIDSAQQKHGYIMVSASQPPLNFDLFLHTLHACSRSSVWPISLSRQSTDVVEIRWLETFIMPSLCLGD